MTGLGPGCAHPYLVCLIDKELVVYKAFHFDKSQNPGHLSIRFSKVRGRSREEEREGDKEIVGGRGGEEESKEGRREGEKEGERGESVKGWK